MVSSFSSAIFPKQSATNNQQPATMSSSTFCEPSCPCGAFFSLRAASGTDVAPPPPCRLVETSRMDVPASLVKTYLPPPPHGLVRQTAVSSLGVSASFESPSSPSVGVSLRRAPANHVWADGEWIHQDSEAGLALRAQVEQETLLESTQRLLRVLKERQDAVYEGETRSHDEMAAQDAEFNELDVKILLLEDLLRTFSPT